MRNILKVTVGILAVIVFLGLDKAWAGNYSIRDRSLNLTVVMDEVPAPSGQGTIIKGSFKNEANGTSGSINTFYKSDITGTQILEFSWVTDNCFGRYFVVPLWSRDSGTPENIFQKSSQRKLVLNFIAGATCDGPLDKLKLEVGEGYYGTGSEENHVHVSNACPHKNQSGNQSNVPQGQNGNNQGNNSSGPNISVNVNNSNNGGVGNNGNENNGNGNSGKGN